jgi:hypothetical protein
VTPELSALLDGEVARRFGRPTLGVWVGHDGRVSENDWLAYLLDVCGKQSDWYWDELISWEVQLYRCTNPDQWWAVIEYDCTDLDHPLQVEYQAPTRLEALARAMLAVPEVE